MNEETIAAISTPPGEGGLAVIRLSGPEAVTIANRLFQEADLVKVASHHARHGHISWKGETIDEVVVIPFHAPRSYTGEEVVEISCHGGIWVSRRILECALEAGARAAEPGEFTRRAYLNGRLDLAQAEAVADLIHARTEASRRQALRQMEGALSSVIDDLKNRFINALALLELELDFGEEDVEFASRSELAALLDTVTRELTRLVASFDRGRVCREGIRMTLVGRPNVGKSSLLNALVEKERAIVTDVPGTTRDIVEDVLDIEGVMFIISDTAGIRHTSDPVERHGVERAEMSLKTADLALFVLDASEPMHEDDAIILKKLEAYEGKVVIAVNKSDLPNKLSVATLSQTLPDAPILFISAKVKTGMDDLVNTLKSKALGDSLPGENEAVLTRVRHRELIVKALSDVNHARSALVQNLSQDFIALDLRGALDMLAELTGQVTSHDILNRIFSDFCIGK